MIDCLCGMKVGHQLLKSGEQKIHCPNCKREIIIIVRFEEVKL